MILKIICIAVSVPVTFILIILDKCFLNAWDDPSGQRSFFKKILWNIAAIGMLLINLFVAIYWVLLFAYALQLCDS